jgi:hypothetical protein
MTQGSVTDEELAELIRRTAEATSAFILGDMRGYLALITHADDYTPMAPFGGKPDARLRRIERAPRSHGTILSGRQGGSGTRAVHALG